MILFCLAPKDAEGEPLQHHCLGQYCGNGVQARQEREMDRMYSFAGADGCEPFAGLIRDPRSEIVRYGFAFDVGQR